MNNVWSNIRNAVSTNVSKNIENTIRDNVGIVVCTNV
jgi:DNA-directed RNA polymerase subunit E'/Rpb7